MINMLDDRVQAELSYALRLDKISEQSTNSSFTLGTLADTVASFKQSCQSKARQAAEVAENVHTDCIEPLKQLLE